MALLETRDLSLGYEGIPIVRNLNFSVNEGDCLCIVGENGSGKTTLMKTLLHLQAPLAGVIVEDDSLTEGGIGYLPQQTMVQKDFPASVYEIVLSGCQAKLGRRFFYSAEEKALAKENMEKMGISHLSERCYRELSGGQQQRVLLARALCATGRILLLDEPVTGLDPAASQDLYSIISQLNRQGLTIIMITHDVSAALQYASHILHISDKIFFGTVKEYLASENGRFYQAAKENGNG